MKRVWGCIDLAYMWPDTPEVGRAHASSNVTARNGLINGFQKLGRTWLGTIEVGDVLTTLFLVCKVLEVSPHGVFARREGYGRVLGCVPKEAAKMMGGSTVRVSGRPSF